jgi:Family of unknown function (DUF7005)
MTGEMELRERVLKDLGATDAQGQELLAYDRNRFQKQVLPSPLQLPLAAEPHLDAWRRYAREAEPGRVLEYLRGRLPQLNFPIQEGISQSEAYRAATLRGQAPPDSGGLHLERSQELALIIHPSPAGPVPIITTAARADFETLVRALAERNEPAPVPPSMGAATIKGYNNWDRMHRLQNNWQAQHPGDAMGLGWADEFERIKQHKELYQDVFIILSDGPYSNVDAAQVGMSEHEWRAASLIIRRDHECTHYFTSRLFGSMENRLLDEIMADFMGLVAATGGYGAGMFLRFMGLEDYPRYREGGRLQNYLGDPPLSGGSFKILQTLTVQAARNLESLAGGHGELLKGLQGKSLFLMALTRLSVEELAGEHAARGFSQALEWARGAAAEVKK